MPLSRLCHHLYTDPAFVFTILMSGVNDTFLLPLEVGGAYDFHVEWGDGTNNHITAWDAADTTHIYATGDTYVIRITGTIQGFNFDWDLPYRSNMREIREWGPVRLGNSEEYFYGCTYLTIIATDGLDLTGTTSFRLFFKVCDGITTVPGMGSWDTSAVTTMASMFYGCHSFDQDIDSWDTSAVTLMDSTFSECTIFDNPLDSWDVSSVTGMTYMFHYASIFNQTLNSWDTSACTGMYYMFSHAEAFNQPLNSWTTSAVTSMAYMFQEAYAFNQDISSWTTSAVLNMRGMFQEAIAFNQPLNTWDTSAVTQFYNIFQRATAFNQPLSNWDVSNIASFSRIFQDATAFNQDLSAWNTASCTNLYEAFDGATSFDQDLSSWDITGVTNMTDMFKGVTLSTANYDALLIGWEGQAVQNGVTFSGGNSKYSAGAAATARQALIDDHTWIITDGGQV